MSTVFFTGFPGFLGSRLLPRVLSRDTETRAVCLIQPKFAELAATRVAEIVARNRRLEGRIQLVEGDITQPDLALAGRRTLQRDVREVYHLAAVYDLTVRRRVGMKVNLEGTRNLLDFAEGCEGLERFQYVSTCYVSGRYPGIFREEDLDKGQKFNNYYEETKFLAEVEVQSRMRGGLPATIYRPSVVVGDSQTGATQKYDGPYFVIRWLLRQPVVAVLPVVGDTHRTRINLVPQDYVLDAISHLSGLASTRGKVFHLADPEPLTIDEILDEIGKATGRLIVRLPLPLFAAKAALDYIPGVYWLMQIPSSSVDYFVHPTYYATTNTQAELGKAGIVCPSVASYLNRLVAFMIDHPEIGSEAMV
jgi:thioester reductase-like protein